MLHNFAKNTLMLYYQGREIQDLIDECIYKVNNGNKTKIDDDASINNICQGYKRINPPAYFFI